MLCRLGIFLPARGTLCFNVRNASNCHRDPCLPRLVLCDMEVLMHACVSVVMFGMQVGFGMFARSPAIHAEQQGLPCLSANQLWGLRIGIGALAS